MVAFARRSTANDFRDDAFEPDDTYAFSELTPGERVCPPAYRSRGAAVLRGLVFLLMVAAGGWMLLNDRASWPSWLDAATDFSTIERWIAEPDGQLASTAEEMRLPVSDGPAVVAAGLPAGDLEPGPPALTPDQAEPTSDVVTLNGPDETADALEAGPMSEDVAALPDAGRAVSEPEPERLPPPEVDPGDPYQKRAASVGLHPNLSRVVLERMSTADYRNAGIAIQKALDQASDAEVIWPRQRTPELALFRVRFVPGAAPGCRRYVVTITKDGWTTTALPMENCGARIASLRAAD